MARLRKVFGTDKTLSREWRMSQLEALERMIVTERKQLQQALFQDLHKNEHECDMTELDFTLGEVAHAKASLDEWMANKPAAVSVLASPGKGELAYDPLGVVLVMGAWNYPVMLTLAPLVGAIAAGNCVVIKPGSYAPAVSHAMASMIGKYLDRDCIVVCEGNRDMTDALLAERFDCIFYTGSGFVGKIVAKAAAEHLCPVILELGGKSPCVVDETACLDLAAARLMWGAFLNSGQTCIRPDFLLVHESVADKFLQLCKAKLAEMHSTNVQQSDTFGRIINHAAFDRLKGILDESQKEIYLGGKTDREDKFVEPTVLDYGTDGAKFDQSAAMRDELFGPILPVLRYKNFESDVIQRIRSLPTGKPLALYLFTENAKTVEQITTRTSCGGMCVNDTLMHIANSELPFGGVGPSGMGSYHGFRSFKSFSHEKAVLTKYSWVDENPALKWALNARYPPYTPGRMTLVGLLSNYTMEAGNLFVQKNLKFQAIVALALVALVLRKLGFSIVHQG